MSRININGENEKGGGYFHMFRRKRSKSYSYKSTMIPRTNSSPHNHETNDMKCYISETQKQQQYHEINQVEKSSNVHRRRSPHASSVEQQSLENMIPPSTRQRRAIASIRNEYDGSRDVVESFDFEIPLGGVSNPQSPQQDDSKIKGSKKRFRYLFSSIPRSKIKCAILSGVCFLLLLLFYVSYKHLLYPSKSTDSQFPNTSLNFYNTVQSDDNWKKKVPKRNGHYTYTDPKSHEIVLGELIKTSPLIQTNDKKPNLVFYASPTWDRLRYPQNDSSSTRPQSAPTIPMYTNQVLDPMLQVSPGEESPPQTQLRKPYTDGNCVPMQEWQTDSKPSCNRLHEIDMTWERRFRNEKKGEQTLQFGGKGWFRIAWVVEETNAMNGKTRTEKYILKTLRYDRDFHDEYYDLHRRDAMAMEHLTTSPFVLDIYSYCGQSAINEIAYDSVEKVAMRMRDNPAASIYKLKMATQVAMGVADIHECDGPSENGVSMVHYDLNPRNIAVMESGTVKINDFNVAEFMKWDTVEQRPCKFKGRLYEPWWRAPEEVIQPKEGMDSHILDEKADVYSLCNILYRILTGRAPRGKSIPERLELVRREVSQGIPPRLPGLYLDTEDDALIALRSTLVHCYQVKPEDRWPARDIADHLYQKLESIMSDGEEQ